MWAWLSKERVHWHLIHYMLKFPVLKKISKVNLSQEIGITFQMRAFILALKCKASVTLKAQEYRVVKAFRPLRKERQCEVTKLKLRCVTQHRCENKS